MSGAPGIPNLAEQIPARLRHNFSIPSTFPRANSESMVSFPSACLLLRHRVTGWMTESRYLGHTHRQSRDPRGGIRLEWI